MVITRHYIGEDWMLRSVILDTVEVDCSHTEKYVSDRYEDTERR